MLNLKLIWTGMLHFMAQVIVKIWVIEDSDELMLILFVI